MATVMFTERKWKEEQQEDREEVNGACGREMKGPIGFKLSKASTAMGVSEEAASVAISRAGEERRSVYLDEDQGIWKCWHCSWTYRLLGSGVDSFLKHQTNCQVVIESRTLTQTQEVDNIKPVIISKHAISGGIDQIKHNVIGVMPPTAVLLSHEDDFNKPMVIVEPSSSNGTSQQGHISGVSAPPTTVILSQCDVQIHVGNQILLETRRENEWEVLKSIVYGGLIESITSLGVVSSATGANTSTLNVVSLGLANLIAGFLVMLHDLSDIKSSTVAANQEDEQAGRYWKLLGRRANFKLHATVSLTSYIIFGLLPPVIYGFSSRDSTEKLIVVAAASLLCIALLAIGKAHLTEPKSYMKNCLYYLGLGFTVSGLSYVAGIMIDRLLQQLGLFEPNAPSVELFGVESGLTSWASW